MTLRRMAVQLHHIPASRRTLLSPEVAILYVPECGKMMRGRQLHRYKRRDLGVLTAVACRALVSAVQTYLTSRPAIDGKRYPFLAKLLDPSDSSQATIPRTPLDIHVCLKQGETMPLAPFGQYPPDEQLCGCSTWYSMAIFASLEMLAIHFNTLLSARTASNLQGMISASRVRWCQEA